MLVVLAEGEGSDRLLVGVGLVFLEAEEAGRQANDLRLLAGRAMRVVSMASSAAAVPRAAPERELGQVESLRRLHLASSHVLQIVNTDPQLVVVHLPLHRGEVPSHAAANREAQYLLDLVGLLDDHHAVRVEVPYADVLAHWVDDVRRLRALQEDQGVAHLATSLLLNEIRPEGVSRRKGRVRDQRNGDGKDSKDERNCRSERDALITYSNSSLMEWPSSFPFIMVTFELFYF